MWESASLCNREGPKWPLLLLPLGSSGCFQEGVISYQCETV